MPSPTLEQIETDIRHLSLTEQLRLMEHLAVRIRQANAEKPGLADKLEAMAQDPEVQNELRLIEAEFAGAEWDGLDAA